jgi:hypothetical protein
MAHDDKKQQLTEYIVLGENPDNSWTINATGVARTPKDAIQNVLLGNYTHQRFVAVPTRSWKPMGVKTEQKTVTTIFEDKLEDASEPEPESQQQPDDQESQNQP